MEGSFAEQGCDALYWRQVREYDLAMLGDRAATERVLSRVAIVGLLEAVGGTVGVRVHIKKGA